VESPGNGGPSGVKSFSITDILSHKPVAGSKSATKESGRKADSNTAVTQQKIVRPWDPQSKSNGRRNSSDSSPLDALFQMTSKTFEGLNGHHESAGKLQAVNLNVRKSIMLSYNCLIHKLCPPTQCMHINYCIFILTPVTSNQLKYFKTLGLVASLNC